MLSDNGRDDMEDDDLDEGHMSANVGILSEKNGNEIPEIPFCGCLSVRFYQPYFDVDTAEIIDRVGHAMFYCRREENFLAHISEKPDAYGPVWIATTLVFTVAVTSHINSWLLSWMSNKTWWVQSFDVLKKLRQHILILHSLNIYVMFMQCSCMNQFYKFATVERSRS